MTIDRWTGRHAAALQRANRMTNEQYAQHLGMSVRAVATWHQQPDIEPATLTQQILDEALNRTPPDVRARFDEAVGSRPREGRPTPSATGAGGGPEPWTLAEAITRSSISPQLMTRFERLVVSQAVRYPSTPPSQMWPVVQREMARIEQALTERQSLSIQRRLVAVVGQLAGLAGNLAVDLGQRAKAAEYFDLGRLAGEETGDDDLTAWALALQSLDPFFVGSREEAASLLDQASMRAATASSARRRAWIEALRARAHAATGDQRNAQSALAAAYELIRAGEPKTGTDFFDQPRLDGIAGTTYMLLGDTGRADGLIGAAIRQRPYSDAKGRALLTLDQAACRVIARAPDDASALVHEAIDIAEGQIVRPIMARVQEVRSHMAVWRDIEAVKVLDERIAVLKRGGIERA